MDNEKLYDSILKIVDDTKKATTKTPEEAVIAALEEALKNTSPAHPGAPWDSEDHPSSIYSKYEDPPDDPEGWV